MNANCHHLKMWNQLYFYRYILVKETFMAKSAKDFPTSSFVVALPHTARLRKDNHLTAMHQIHFFTSSRGFSVSKRNGMYVGEAKRTEAFGLEVVYNSSSYLLVTRTWVTPSPSELLHL